MLRQKFSAINTFIDVGSNIGQTALKVKSVLPSVHYYGFEPNVNCYKTCLKLARLNSWQNIEFVNLGLSDTISSADLYFYGKGNKDTTASTLRSYRESKQIKRTSRVQLTTLNKVFKANTLRIDFIKIDVEGGELEVLKGGQELLAAQRPSLLFEILPPYSTENKIRIERQNEIWELLMQLGYDVFRITIEKSGSFKLKKIDQFPIHSEILNTNYLATYNRS